MSTVEVEFREATCPRCGALASEYFERYLRPGEIPFFGICYCDVPLVYEKVFCYQAVCDRCGQHVTEYGEWSALTPEWWLWDSLPDWRHLYGRDLCPSCWFIDDNDEIEELCRE